MTRNQTVIIKKQGNENRKTLGRVRMSKTILCEGLFGMACLSWLPNRKLPAKQQREQQQSVSGSDSWRSNNNSPGGWGNRGKTGGGTEGQVHVEEEGLDHGAGTDSEVLEDLDHGAEADSEALEDLGHGAVADGEALEDLDRGSVADSGTLEGLGRGAMADREILEQGEPVAMAGQAEQAAMAGQAEQAEQTGAEISIVELVTSTAERFLGRHGRSTVCADTSGGIGANSWTVEPSGTDSWTDEASGADSWTDEASGADSWTDEASGPDSWIDEASEADSWIDEASGAQCAAHTLKMATAITGSTVDSGMSVGLEGVDAVHLWLGNEQQQQLDLAHEEQPWLGLAHGRQQQLDLAHGDQLWCGLVQGRQQQFDLTREDLL
ncbi:hypothetical protein M9458_057541 [Cirrhinus mrigala]|uniref:Uncharacterized protein n=1 Tax=Cirrhinus mrigala TaxID=683832 RepID=A0ABD0MB96_CIRMR